MPPKNQLKRRDFIRQSAATSLFIATGISPATAAVSTVEVAPSSATLGPAPTEAATAAHAMLTRLCDDFGGRLSGSAANAAAVRWFAAELQALGIEPELQHFSMPGWEHNLDEATLSLPFERSLRVTAMCYTQPTGPLLAPLWDLKQGRTSDYPAHDIHGFIGLIAPGSPLPMREHQQNARARGLVGLLLINREAGGQLLIRTGSHIGEPLAVPALSITQEEGLWLQRLLARNEEVRVSFTTRSRCLPVETANIRIVFPGKSPSRLIVGAHFDGWDLGQAAVDNGLGTAQLFALAHALRRRNLHHTVELIWFNGEEQGLWGSRHAAACLADTPVIAMLNFDMVGVPQTANALGETDLMPVLEAWNESRGALRLPQGVQNTNWLGSDHNSYQLAGYRTLGLGGAIPRESVRYYHDLADTIDKVSPELLAASYSIIADFVLSLADNPLLRPFRRSETATAAHLVATGLDRRLQAVGLWPFPSTSPVSAT
jgi:hypothetical protein